MMKMFTILSLVLMLLLLAAPSWAATLLSGMGSNLYVDSDTGTTTFRAVGDRENSNVWYNEFGQTGGNGVSWVISFQLPTLAAGEGFISASFGSVHNGEDGGFTWPNHELDYLLDLYALSRVASTDDVLLTDHYSGPLDTSGNAVLIQNDYLTGGTAGLWTPTTIGASAETTLVDWLNDMYDNGNNAGMYVFLRYSPDQEDGTYSTDMHWRQYQVMTVDCGTETQSPLITYTAGPVPEPACVSLLLVGSVVLIRRRRCV